MFDLLGAPFEELEGFLDGIGVGRGHASKVFRSIHRNPQPLREVTNLGWRHAEAIEANSHRATAEVVGRVHANGGVERLIFRLDDGSRVEGVILPSKHPKRATLCLSSQVGCAMACRFCATGTLGLSRHLTAGEIVAQVVTARALLEAPRRLTHLVFMGQGEPLHAYESVRDALSVLFDVHGQPFVRDQVTVSTVGLVSRIEQLGRDFGGQVQLAVSLHAGTDETRRRIIPTAKNVEMAELRRAAIDYEKLAGTHLMAEYVILPGINDTDEELEALAEWMQGTTGVVNLIPFNPFPGSPYRSPTEEEAWSACRRLREHNVVTHVRWPRGREANGACGQLMLANG